MQGLQTWLRQELLGFTHGEWLLEALIVIVAAAVLVPMSWSAGAEQRPGTGGVNPASTAVED